MNKLPVIDKCAARLLMVSFFLPMQLQVWAVMAVSVYFVSRTFIEKERIPRSNFVWALILGSGYLLYLFSFPLTPAEYKGMLSTLCERRVSFLLMPFVFAIITPRFGGLIWRELIWFVYGCLVSCIAGNAGFVYQYYFAAGMHTLSHMGYRLIFETFTGIHPTYMGMYLCFSICILLVSPGFNTGGAVIVKYVLVYLLLFFLLSLLPKSALIALVIIFIHYAYLHRRNLLKYKIRIAALLASVIAACFFIPFTGQRVKEILSYFGYGKPGSTVDNSVYIRKLIWDVDTGLLKPNWLTGVGPGRMLHMLHERYFFYSLANHFNVGYYDPHNEYFSTWLSFGIIGITLFVAVLAIHCIRAIRGKNNLYSYLLIILCITFCTETVLSRQQGVLFYAVFTSLFFFLNSYHQPDDSKQR